MLPSKKVNLAGEFHWTGKDFGGKAFMTKFSG